MKEGTWSKKKFAKCRGLKGKTLGLIGLGNISSKVATVMLAMGLRVVANDPWAKPMEGVELLEDRDQLIRESDIISIHVPSLPATNGMVNSEFLGKMKDDAVFINTARSELVVEADILARLESHPDFWYAADVFDGESDIKDNVIENDLAKHPKVLGTHHIGASTKQAEAEIGEECVRILGVLKETSDIDDFNWVNKDGFVGK